MLWLRVHVTRGILDTVFFKCLTEFKGFKARIRTMSGLGKNRDRMSKKALRGPAEAGGKVVFICKGATAGWDCMVQGKRSLWEPKAGFPLSVPSSLLYASQIPHPHEQEIGLALYFRLILAFWKECWILDLELSVDHRYFKAFPWVLFHSLDTSQQEDTVSSFNLKLTAL